MGLGLSIVKRITDILHVNLEIHSEEGVGTIFSIYLPVAEAEPIHANETQNVNKGKLQLNVLLVDDNQDILNALKLTVEDWGCKVTLASNMPEAICKATSENPDLIISDYRLSDGVTGLDVSENINRTLNREVPIIIISGDTAPDLITQIREQRVHLLHKPVKSTLLRNTINKLVNTNGVYQR